MSDTILILESKGYNPDAIAVYSEIAIVKLQGCNDMETDAKESVTTLVCRLGYHLNTEFLAAFPKLRYIVSPTTGLNHIDLDYCESHRIQVVSLKGETKFLDSIRSTSEHTIALMLALVRNIVPGVKSVVEKNQWDRDLFRGREMSALILGVLGVGRIGRHIINYAKAFGMSVLIFDPFKDLEKLECRQVKVCSKKELLKQADIVTIHVDYRPENQNLISKDEFGLMKRGSYFVNTSRGELVLEEDLIWALEEGILAGAALDVLSNENDIEALFNKRIFQYAEQNDNIIITPHVGGCTSDAMHNTELFIAQKWRTNVEKCETKTSFSRKE